MKLTGNAKIVYKDLKERYSTGFPLGNIKDMINDGHLGLAYRSLSEEDEAKIAIKIGKWTLRKIKG